MLEKDIGLALFDFDGTITTEDTFTQFILYSTPKWRLCLGFIMLLPLLLLYKVRLVPASKLRPIISSVAFWNRGVVDVSNKAELFVKNYIQAFVRPKALTQIEWHKSRGDSVYVVSASINVYLKIWCAQQEVQLLCSHLEIVDNQYTGGYINNDCSGKAKVHAIKRAVNLSEYSEIYAYGDAAEDIPMLALADVKFYRWQLVNNY